MNTTAVDPRIFTPLSEADHAKLSRLVGSYRYRDVILALLVEARHDGAHNVANDIAKLYADWDRRGIGRGADVDYMGESTEAMPRLWLDVARDRGAKFAEDGSIDGRALADVGVFLLNGCAGCSATVAPYNSYQIAPNNDYAYCASCAGVDGD